MTTILWVLAVGLLLVFYGFLYCLLSVAKEEDQQATRIERRMLKGLDKKTVAEGKS